VTGSSPTEPLAQVQDLHRAAHQSIHTLVCDLKVTRSNGTHVARYVRSGENVFVSVRDPRGFVVEASSDGTVVRSITKTKPGALERPGGGVRAADGTPVTACDLWAGGALLLPLPNHGTYHTFDRLLREASTVRGPARETVDGRDLVAVELVLDKPGLTSIRWTERVYFDPGVNWLARRYTLIGVLPSGKKVVRTREVKQFQEPSPGVFVPTLVEGTLRTDGGNPKTILAITVTNVRVNQPVSQGTFRLTYPRGLNVFDRIQGVTYQVEESGRPMTAPKVYELDRSPPPSDQSGGALKPVSAASPPREFTKEEPRSLVRYVLPLGVGTLALAVLLKSGRTFRPHRVGGA
jgi:hypothetical protein